MLVFAARDLDAVVRRLKARDASVITLGGAPLPTPAGRAILVRDPDGYPILVTQASRAEIEDATAPGQITSTSLGVTVADTDAALAFYRGLLGFAVGETRAATDAELRLRGLTEGHLSLTPMSIPGANVTVELSEFELPATMNPRPTPFAWRIQDVGAPQFQLEVTGLDTLLERTSAAGYRFLSVGGKPIERPFGRFVFVVDPDGVLVEYVEPVDSE